MSRWATRVLTVLFLVLVSTRALAETEAPLPKARGFYAVQEHGLLDLDREIGKSPGPELTPDVRFVFSADDQVTSEISKIVTLQRLAFLRYEIDVSGMRIGVAKRWNVPRLGQRRVSAPNAPIKMNAVAVAGRRDVVRLVSEKSLEPGRYVVSLADRAYPFGVGPRKRDESTPCFDLFLEPMRPVQYRQCEEE